MLDDLAREDHPFFFSGLAIYVCACIAVFVFRLLFGARGVLPLLLSVSLGLVTLGYWAATLLHIVKLDVLWFIGLPVLTYAVAAPRRPL